MPARLAAAPLRGDRESLARQCAPERGTQAIGWRADGYHGYPYLPARRAPADELAARSQLEGLLKARRHLTKFRKKSP